MCVCVHTPTSSVERFSLDKIFSTPPENSSGPEFPNLIPEKEIVCTTADEDDSDTSDDDDLGLDMEDAAPNEAVALRRELSVFLPDERTIPWQRKKVAKSSLHKPPL